MNDVKQYRVELVLGGMVWIDWVYARSELEAKHRAAQAFYDLMVSSGVVTVEEPA